MHSPFSVKHITIILRLVFTMLDVWEKAQFTAQRKDLPFYNHSRSRISVPQELSPGTVVANKRNSGDMQLKKKPCWWRRQRGKEESDRNWGKEMESAPMKISFFYFCLATRTMRVFRTNIFVVRWVSNKTCLLNLVFSFILIIVLRSQLLVQIGLLKLSWFGE